MKLALGVVVLCVAAPGCQRGRAARGAAADCQAVAGQLTSIELGNYAEPEARSPVIARYKAACDAALVSKEEAQCLDKARDTWSAGQCVPRMFPELASSSTADCAAIVAKTKTMMVKQAAYLSDPKLNQWFDRTMAVMRESCEQDHWPDLLKKCMLESDGSAATMQRCNQQMPPALQQKMQDRLTKAMQQLQARERPAPGTPNP